MGRMLVLFTVLCNLLFVWTAFDIGKKKVILQNMAQCKDGRHLPLIIYGFKMNYVNDSHSIFSLKFNVKKETSHDLSVAFDVMKCDASGSLDSCEYILKDRNVTDICSKITEKNQIWSSFFECFDKPFICPIKPGIYTLTDSPVKTDFLTMFPIGDALWRAKVNTYDKGVLIGCMDIVMRIVPYLVKRS